MERVHPGVAPVPRRAHAGLRWGGGGDMGVPGDQGRAPECPTKVKLLITSL